MNQYNFGLRSAWSGAPESDVSVADRLIKTVDALSEAQACFRIWEIGDIKKKRMTSLAAARLRMTELVRAGVYRDDSGKTTDGGYSVFALAGPPKDPGSRLFALTATAGSKWDLNKVELAAGYNSVEPDLSIVSYPIFRSALDIMISNWPCAWANVYAYRFGYPEESSAPGVPPFQYSRFHMPWMSYLSPRLATGLTPPQRVDVEHLTNGGLIMIATKERLDPTDTLHMTRSRILSETMIDRLGVDG